MRFPVIKQIKKFSTTILLLALLFQSISCGTLIYPERRGQTSGHIDPGVAILDGVGLLLFVVPGAVAFAVDFITGSIYLPAGSSSATKSKQAKHLQVLRVDPPKLTKHYIEETVETHTGHSIRLNQPDIEIYRLRPNENVGMEIAKINQSGTLFD